MATLHALMVGLQEIFVLKLFLMMCGVTLVGLLMGAAPGLTATMAVALLIPITFPLSTTYALVLTGTIYMSAIYGGSFSAILLNTPGTPSSIATCFDGYPMAKRGEGQRAIFIASFSSAYGGLFGVIFLLLLAVPLSVIALKFGPPEYFWLAVLGMTVIAALSTGNIVKGFIGGAIGILISTIGIAPVGGSMRFTMGIANLNAGVALIPALIGFFCIPPVLDMIVHREEEIHLLKTSKVQPRLLLETFKEVMKKQVDLIRASFIGLFIGMLPGAGGSVANLVAYEEAQRVSKHPEKFGTGIPEGVIASETANNAVVGGSLIPLLTLGVPGSPPAAVMYGALLMHGVQPGPQLFTGNSQAVFTFIVGLFVATLLMLPIGIPLAGGMTKLVSRLSIKVLAPFIIFLTIIGSYSVRNNILDVYIMLTLGVLGYVLKKLGFEPGPITLGLILGPIAETGLIQSLLIGRTLPYSWMILFKYPLSWVLIILSITSLFWPLFRKIFSKKASNSQQSPDPEV